MCKSDHGKKWIIVWLVLVMQLRRSRFFLFACGVQLDNRVPPPHVSIWVALTLKRHKVTNLPSYQMSCFLEFVIKSNHMHDEDRTLKPLCCWKSMVKSLFNTTRVHYKYRIFSILLASVNSTRESNGHTFLLCTCFLSIGPSSWHLPLSHGTIAL